MDDVYKKSLELHAKVKGKISIAGKVDVQTKDDLALVYTPGVAESVREIGKDKEKVFDYTGKGNTVLIVTDGSAILGLGDLGPEAALPVMEGKALLFKKFAGIDAFPLCLDTKDPEEIVRIVKAVAPVAGAINLEDIASPRCFLIEERLRNELSIPIMHDDQHGTATVVLAGLLNALRVAHKSPNKDIRIVISGVGAAGTAIARILSAYGFHSLILVDSKGIISKDRPDLTLEKSAVALFTNHDNMNGSLADALVNADVFIGVSKGNIVTEEMVKRMNPNPIIFALANPTPEILPDLARAAGAAVIATGRSDFPNQINNALAYPGLFRGALQTRRQFSNDIFIKAAEILAALVQDPTADKIIPDIFDPRIVPALADAFKK